MRVESYYIQDWEEAETGLLIDENEEWILVKHIPVDYLVDGYKLYKKQFIERRVHSRDEQQIEKVLALKQESVSKPADFVFADTTALLRWIEGKYGLFEFQDENEEEIYYGKIRLSGGCYMVIDMVQEDGSVDQEDNYDFSEDEIRSMAFEGDYHRSMCLLWKDWEKSNS